MFTHISLPNALPAIKVEQQQGQRFYVTPTNRYPSITTLLGHKEKPWLQEWRNMLGQDKADKETKRCADRGESVHTIIEKYLNNKTDLINGQTTKNIQLFNQLKLALNKMNNIRAQEIALYSDVLRVAGRVDCIAEYDGILSVVDFKTSNNNKSEKMIEDYFLQCTAYAVMWHELTGEPVQQVVILMSVERGMVPLVFKENIDKYVKPLLKRIDEYYRAQK